VPLNINSIRIRGISFPRGYGKRYPPRGYRDTLTSSTLFPTSFSIISYRRSSSAFPHLPKRARDHLANARERNVPLLRIPSLRSAVMRRPGSDSWPRVSISVTLASRERPREQRNAADPAAESPPTPRFYVRTMISYVPVRKLPRHVAIASIVSLFRSLPSSVFRVGTPSDCWRATSASSASNHRLHEDAETTSLRKSRELDQRRGEMKGKKEGRTEGENGSTEARIRALFRGDRIMAIT